MKGMANRQKMIVRPRETAQKFIIQQKNIQASIESHRREKGKKGSPSRGK